MKFDEKWMPKGHPKSLKIDALGALGADFCDFYDFWQGSFFYVFSFSKEGAKTHTNLIFWAALGAGGLKFHIFPEFG